MHACDQYVEFDMLVLSIQHRQMVFIFLFGLLFPILSHFLGIGAIQLRNICITGFAFLRV